MTVETLAQARASDVVAVNVRRLAHIDLPGGGQIFVSGGRAYVGHMAPPHGTSIIDVSDPQHPRLLSRLEVAAPSHTHKVRAVGDLMAVNCEQADKRSGQAYAEGGFRLWDVADPARPRLASFTPFPGIGVHRFDFDGRYAYLSTTMDGYAGNIIVILDCSDPGRPREVSRWWLHGQWTAGGEKPYWTWPGVGCHHPLRFGDRLYVGYLHGGVVILDIADITRPQLVGHFDYHPAFACITHTFARMPFQLGGRDIAIAVDEQPSKSRPGQVPAFMWVFDVTDEAHPSPIATYTMSPEETPWRELPEQASRFGAHQPHERPSGSLVHVAWFRGGLRIVDLADPMRPETVGAYIPVPTGGNRTPMSNDVFVDDRGLIYLLDRLRGLDILEYTGTAGLTAPQA